MVTIEELSRSIYSASQSKIETSLGGQFACLSEKKTRHRHSITVSRGIGIASSPIAARGPGQDGLQRIKAEKQMPTNEDLVWTVAAAKLEGSDSS